MNTLDNWIINKHQNNVSENNQEFNKISLKYFYLEWISSKTPTVIKWYKTQPPDCNIIKSVKIRGGPEIIVCGKLYKQFEKKDPYSDLNDIEKGANYCEYTNSPLLKSHIQKCVRRMLDTNSVLSAFHLMRLDFSSFARRFPIIAIEDASLHIGLAVLIWFMMVDPKQYLSRTHIRYFLGLVVKITKCKELDRAELENGKVSKQKDFDVFPFWHKCETLKCNALQTILFSLVVRRSYGGMSGDMGMLAATCEKWYAENNIKDHMITKCNQVKITRYLALNDFVLAGVDFHCFPNIIYKIAIKYPDVSEEKIKQCIWTMSSSLNYRTHVSKSIEMTKMFEMLKATYYLIAKRLLYNCY